MALTRHIFNSKQEPCAILIGVGGKWGMLPMDAPREKCASQGETRELETSFAVVRRARRRELRGRKRRQQGTRDSGIRPDVCGRQRLHVHSARPRNEGNANAGPSLPVLLHEAA